MDVFDLRERLVGDFSEYAKSFMNIADARIHELVDTKLEEGLLWPDPKVQLNPAFERGGSVDDLVNEGVLHSECSRIFRRSKTPGAGQGSFGEQMHLHRHQDDAIRVARSAENYVLTTGTGSGKSLAYIIPIVDHVLRRGSGKGIQAVIVYPMNALANSQFGELEKFLKHGYPPGGQPVTWRRYTGQESDEERREIIANPPDILLTNYVMLELILTRPDEGKLVKAMRGLQFLVFDELHTYRGRQGSDVAMLMRRVREACESPALQHVGTSATLAGEGTVAAQKIEVARLATTLFGATVKPECVIGETLRRATSGSPTAVELGTRLGVGVTAPETYEAFAADPLAAWIETTLGLAEEPETGVLIRQTPRNVGEAATLLSEQSSVPEERCAEAIRDCLMTGYHVHDPDAGSPVFAFRLHQFISRGDTVYATLEPPESREITTEPQRFAPSSRDKVLMPLAFCRECGQEYYVAQLESRPDDQDRLVKREMRDREKTDSIKPGYLYVSTTAPWPDDDEVELVNLVPQTWTEEHNGLTRLKRHYREQLPTRVYVGGDGTIGGGGNEAWFVPAPFRFCLKCGVAHSSNIRSDFGKLATLGTEARSTATTILAITALRNLRADLSLSERARKLLSFSDNRQDAALQAGHFNDFVEVGLLRSGLYHAAMSAGEQGLGHQELTTSVMEAMGLVPMDYAAAPEAKFAAERRAREALLDVVGYRLYRDMQRGWRLTSPNLEQCGLLRVEYEDLAELCADEESWRGCHEALLEAEPQLREEVSKALLDHMRRVLAIKVQFLDPNRLEQMKSQSYTNLRDPWDFSTENLEYATVVFPRTRSKADDRSYTFVSGRSGFARYISQNGKLGGGEPISRDDCQLIIGQMLNVLASAGLVEQVIDAERDEDVPGYQLQSAAMRWIPGDGTTPAHDPVRVPRLPAEGARVNAFFVDYYRTKASTLKDMRAAEHTAQVLSEERERREEAFREAKLPLLFCSPTMELGVDISELNCVNMRNVPPTPANYAQRSGRAGRSGQPALVFTYCSAGSPHDQYFFRRPEEMVSGQVTPPRLDLSNEDLLRAHVHSIWIHEAGLALGRSLGKVLDVEGDTPSLELLPTVLEKLENATAATRTIERARRVLDSIPMEMLPADWNAEQWLGAVVRALPRDFQDACDRWRELYRAAMAQQARANRTMLDASSSMKDKNSAKAARAEAEAQLGLLLASNDRIMQSDFYSYRYFASEGFLPGYNFPRLPLSAFIPGRRGGRGTDEFLSRPRFLAISEFGPNAYVYHEGLRYQIVKAVLPVEAEGTGTERILKRSIKLCSECGYLHPIEQIAPDICASCGAELPAPVDQLFRLTNVGTRRRDRINSDEEERQRQGFELTTAFRFAEREGELSKRTAVASFDGETIADLAYGHSATLWRMNLGLKRRKDQAVKGFLIDVDSGMWAKSEEVEDTAGKNETEPQAKRTERVVPFVEDRRNCLVFTPTGEWDSTVMASLSAALKSAIQVTYQLEDSELAVEPLPDRAGRRALLFYEAAEGGAGVLRRLVEDPTALPRVAARALELCHFDPSGTDMGYARGAKEPCTAACYDCLMSYYNQPDHELLDRFQISGLLLQLAKSSVEVSPNALPREEHFERLMRLTDSDLERKWLTTLRDASLRLPTDAQPLVEAAGARPDFLYRDHSVAIFIDGPVHDDEATAADDSVKREALDDLGYTMIVFRYDDDWPALLKRFPEVFGGSR
ncbi:MAG: DEAD/DEAH box helicase [Coriobacteriia bacterium]|nr:DEAD/DEAH box helicase [Coriobacteriia bacterium]